MPTSTRLFHALLVVGAFTATNCNGFDTLQVQREGSGSLPARDPDDPDAPLPVLFSMQVATSGEDGSVDARKIDKLYLDELVLVADSDTRGDDFGLLKEIEVYVENDELEPVLVAHGGPFRKGETSIALDTTGADITAFLRHDEVTVTARATGLLPERKLPIAATATFSVDVNVLNAACNR